MQLCTLVIERPTEPISLGMRLVGGRVTEAYEGIQTAEKEAALRAIFMEMSELRALKTSSEHFVLVMSDRLSRLNGIAFGIHATGITTIDEYRRLKDMILNAYDLRFQELCCEHIPGWGRSPSNA